MTATLPSLANLKPNPAWASLPLFDRTGWKRVRFGEVVENCAETCDPAEAGLERFVAMEHLEPGSLHVRSWGNVMDGTTFTRRCRPGQVLFGKRRAYQRKVAVAEFEAVVSGDIYVLAPKDDRLLPELLPFLCLSERFFQHAVGTSAGSLSPRTNWSSLASFEFDLPPLDQQRRIAEILWAVDEAVAKKEQLAGELKTFSRLAIRAALADGEFHDGRRLKASKWKGAKLGDLCELRNGRGFSAAEWSQEGLPIIRIQNLNGSREFNYFTGDAEVSWIVEPGTLLFAWAGVRGVSFGPCVWNGPRGVLNQHIFRILPHVGINQRWLFETLKVITVEIEKKAHGFKIELVHARKGDITDQPVRVPPEDEQLVLAEYAKSLSDAEAFAADDFIQLKAVLSASLNAIFS
jgi:type I restriction enzyme S subunit